MRKKSVILVFACLAILSLVFQNCGAPVPIDTNISGSRNNNFNREPGDTTPRLTIPDDANEQEFQAPDLSMRLLSTIQDSGTNAREFARGIVQTTEGGFITAGTAIDAGDNSFVSADVLFKKFDRDGSLIYSRRIGDGYENQSYKVIELPDVYLAVGLTRTVLEPEEQRTSDVLFVRIEKNSGDVIEAFRYGTNHVEAITDVIYTIDANGPVLVGAGYYLNCPNPPDCSNNKKDGFIIKLDIDYNVLWANRFQGPGGDDLVFQKVAHVPQGGYYAVGFREGGAASAPLNDQLITRFSHAGAFLGSRILPSPNINENLRDVGFNGTDIIAVGRQSVSGRGAEGVIHRFDLALSPRGSYTLGRTGSSDFLMDLNTHPDGSLVLAGLSNAAGSADNWIIKIRDYSTVEFSQLYGTNQTDNNQFNSLILRKDFGYAFITNMNEGNGSFDPALLLLDQFGEVPLGCDYHDLGNNNPPTFQVLNSAVTFQNYQLTTAFVTLTPESIDFDSNSDEPTSTNYCVN